MIPVFMPTMHECDEFYHAQEEERSIETMISKDSISLALHRFPQWVRWRYQERGPGKKPDKAPINPSTMKSAGVTWPNTWTNLHFAHRVYYEAVTGHPRYRSSGIKGLGFVLTHNDPIVAVDIDGCIDEGRPSSYASDIVQELGSSSEISPSGHGLRILLTCPDYLENHKTKAWGIYAQARYGHRCPY